jgi:hypothetical protein
MRAFALGLLLALTFAGRAQAAPAPPRTPHPRIYLNAGTLAAIKKNGRQSGTWAARAVEVCQDASRHPERYLKSGYQGSDWAAIASTCGMAWQMVRDPKLAAAGIRMWRALMEDVETVGDGKACKASSPPQNWNASIWRDTGYAIRFVGPHAALAYDWLHDAPGVDEALLRQSRACFGSWVDWYTKDGYMHSTPGANYHAGFVFAKSLIAIATAGEDAAGDRAWKEVVDDIFGAQIIGQGLAGAGEPVGKPAGALLGGDWPEGWQYGPLSVIEYALAARAVEENGAPLPAVRHWLGDVVVRALHGVTPGGDRVYVGGDTDYAGYYLPQNGAGVAAALLGLTGDRAAAWARFSVGKRPPGKEGNPAIEALAELRTVPPEDYRRGGPPPYYLARGTRNVYARSDWKDSAFWAVFTSAPRLVPDHQHPNASNFVLSRGSDDLIVDPSPYGTRSTMTGNAATVAARVVGTNYLPSQTSWSHAELPWARATKSGIVAARADYHLAFQFSEIPSDIQFALRDWVFIPEGEIVSIDRTATGAAERKTYLRFKTPAHLALGADHRLASGVVGRSSIAIHAVDLSGGNPVVRTPPIGHCDVAVFGACEAARLRVDEYALEIPGPTATAVHVIDGLNKGEPPAEVRAQKSGGLGVLVKRGARRTLVMTSGRTSAGAESRLAYSADGGDKTWHVVFDAPEDDRGRATVTASAANGQCAIEIKPGGSSSFTGRPLIFVVAGAAAGCAVTEDPAAPWASAP